MAALVGVEVAGTPLRWGLRSKAIAATVRRMQQQLSYRHRVITDDDLVFIRRLIAEHPGSSRRNLSKKLCVAWNWVQANGALRDMVCRELMLMLHREGLIMRTASRTCPSGKHAVIRLRLMAALVGVEVAGTPLRWGGLAFQTDRCYRAAHAAATELPTPRHHR